MAKAGLDISQLKSTSVNNVKIYSIARHRSLPTWLPPKKVRALRKDKDYRERIDLIQDLWFETAATKVKATPDGEYIVASGIYPPQIKVYTVRELAMKFERHFKSEIVNFQILDDDYSKMAFLCTDRSICLHAKYGSHYSLRIPRMGRDLTYDCWSCDLLCAASSPDIYRINLEQGRFLSPLSSQSQAINVVSRSWIHGLVACGGDDGVVECFDLRMKSSVGRINAVTHAGDTDQEVTSLQFDGDGGYFLAVGSSAGKILIYDLRSSHPIRVKDHMYGSPIVDIKWHRTPNSAETKLISTDKHVIRIWYPETGDNFTSIEPGSGTINDVCVFPDTGLMLVAQDSSRISPYFIPSLGPAPKWCSHLDGLTEELEEVHETTIYDNYKYLTKEDLERLNLTNLIGTPYLKAYMHGFFINYRLYNKAVSLVDPFAYDTYIEKKKQEKLEAERASRITIKRKLPPVNRELAARLLENDESDDETNNEDVKTKKKLSKKNKVLGTDLFDDDRFAAMFKDKDFEVDEFSHEYLSLHPQTSRKQSSLIKEHFEPALEDGQRIGDSDASMASQSDGDSDGDKGGAKKRTKVPRLYEVKDERHAEAYWRNASLAEEDVLPLGHRVAALQEKQKSRVSGDVKVGPGGSREISFVARRSSRYEFDGEREKSQRGKRRGIQSLGLKPDRSEFHGSRGRGSRGRGGHGGRRGGRDGGRRGGRGGGRGRH